MIGFITIDAAEEFVDARLRSCTDGREKNFPRLKQQRKSWQSLLKAAETMGITKLHVFCWGNDETCWAGVATFLFRSGAAVHEVKCILGDAQRLKLHAEIQACVARDTAIESVATDIFELQDWRPRPKSEEQLEELIDYRNELINQRAEYQKFLEREREPLVLKLSRQPLELLTDAIADIEAELRLNEFLGKAE